MAAREARDRANWRRELTMFALSVALTLPLFAQMFTMFDFGNLGHSLQGHHEELLPRWLQLAYPMVGDCFVMRRLRQRQKLLVRLT